ncbi:capsular polysaccharide biosynthesis protein [Nibrella saemangeumensis]|uniref:protein-tyrosine-phosphatase n=1 Tax=Nibrella saemangeumensis TaxID=1084526 RepID=A0ABP8N2K5_9BACT
MSIWSRFKQAFNGHTGETAELPANPCFWQADMHSHFLPGVDDGVDTPEQALECLQQFAEWGIRTVITTPHVSRDWHPNESATLRAGQATLQTLANAHNLPLRIEVAAEYLIDDFFPELLAHNDLLTFGPQKYLLIETGWASAPFQFSDLVFRIQTKGYTPVLAHPERYRYFHDDLAGLTRLHEAGCHFQLNWMSLTGRYGSRIQAQARLLLKHGLVDFLGSDLHRPQDLPALAALFTSSDYELLKAQPLKNAGLV